MTMRDRNVSSRNRRFARHRLARQAVLVCLAAGWMVLSVGVGSVSAEQTLRAAARVPMAAVADASIGERLIETLSRHNTQMVLMGTCLLSATAGVVGVFMVLRRRALVGDVVGHSALPGIVAAFLVMEMIEAGSGKSMPALLAGAFVAGLAGAVSVMLIDRYSRVKADAALAIVLSVFYGGGVALLSVVQEVPSGSAAGLNTLLIGMAASLVSSDVTVFAVVAGVILLTTLLLFKELTLMCFDEQFAAAEGWPVFLLDALLISLVVAVTIIGMQSVGLILVVGILIIPASASRFWTDDIRWMVAIAAAIGAMSSIAGILISALFPRIAAGAMIVLCGSAFFVFSLCCGKRRGLFWRVLERRRLRIETGRHDLLREVFELLESRHDPVSKNDLFILEELSSVRSWPPAEFRSLVTWALRAGLLRSDADGMRFSERGLAEARRLVRNHRLWEMYLIRYADVAPSHVDRDADLIEHVLDDEVVSELEGLLQDRTEPMPVSPHVVGMSEKT